MTAPLPRLLVVDDNTDLLEFFQLAIAREGFEVSVAEDGAKALGMLSSFKPDIILLDLMMPVLDGFQFIDRLKAERILDIPVVIMTGYWEEGRERQLRQEPMVAEFLRKPVKLNELLPLLRAVLAKHRP
ncbi:MAG: response regulator [Elusimicrobia bacterium]|nr:response regulator [Elusimicrobiota bacterium]